MKKLENVAVKQAILETSVLKNVSVIKMVSTKVLFVMKRLEFVHARLDGLVKDVKCKYLQAQLE